MRLDEIKRMQELAGITEAGNTIGIQTIKNWSQALMIYGNSVVSVGVTKIDGYSVKWKANLSFNIDRPQDYITYQILNATQLPEDLADYAEEELKDEDPSNAYHASQAWPDDLDLYRQVFRNSGWPDILNDQIDNWLYKKDKTIFKTLNNIASKL